MSDQNFDVLDSIWYKTNTTQKTKKKKTKSKISATAILGINLI